MSALLRIAAALGGGSKVWLLVPSGTIPVTCARSPTMLEVIEVIGETVVAIRSLPSPSPPPGAPLPAHPARTSAAARQAAGPTAHLARNDEEAMPGR
jgi:hypothetical protein